MDRPTAHLHLAIELDSDPIAGSLAGPNDAQRAFSGWVELVAAIEDARSGSPVTEAHPGAGRHASSARI